MTVRVGFLGCGFIAAFHAAMLRSGGADATVVAVYDPDAEAAAAFAARWGSTAVESEEALFEQVDAVYVCTWTSEHPRLVQAACERGLAVFCEKPLGVDLAAARSVAEAVAESSVVAQSGLVLRDSPAFAMARRLIEDPASGRPMAVVFRDDQYLPVQGIYGSTWRSDPARAGRGALLEHSIHDVDLLEQLVGPVRSVRALVADHHGLGPIEDTVSAVLEHRSGATSTLTSVWHDVLSRPSQRRVEVFCTGAWVAVEGDVFGPVRWSRQEESPVVPGLEGSFENHELLDALAEGGWQGRNPDVAFVEAVTEGRPARPSIADALRAHVVVDALYRSAEAEGARVVVPEP
ncbi:MAG: Gfo/Idh/MocA family oxidoreductase [Acidimicrobiia bacterium]|nr:Gfo/Idh/MocA family oxidoreductase [Acidimicrobiia bacterium]